MTIENGGEIDAGDGNCLVTARGTKDGLIIRMDGRADISALQQALESFLNNRHSFLQGNEVFLEWVGAKPSPESRDKVANLFKLHGVRVFSSRGVSERESDQRREGELIAHEQKMVAVGGGAGAGLGALTHGVGAGLDPYPPSGVYEGRSLFDGVRSLGLGRGDFYDEAPGSESGGWSRSQGDAPTRPPSAGSSARLSSMARFSEILGSSDIDSCAGLEGAESGAGSQGGFVASVGHCEAELRDEVAQRPLPADQGSLQHGSARRGALKDKALASLGRAGRGSSLNPPSRLGGHNDAQLRGLDPEAQLERVFAEKIMSSDEGLLGSDFRSSYGIEGSAWDDADARIVTGTIRSGQRIETEHSLVILGDVNSGGEIVAGGDIIVLGTLRGVAHAGAFEESGGGRVIVAMDLQPTQLRIGNVITRGGTESSQGAAAAIGGMRASLGLGQAIGLRQAKGGPAKSQASTKSQIGSKASSSMEVAWVEGATIVVEPYQSRGMGVGRRGGR